MTMKAMYNAGAQLSLAQLNKNITKAGNAMAKLSSGERKIGAQDDDSASFGISEKMREQIRSLLQDNQNVQNGSSMIKIAERGIDQIVQELTRLKELAINAANDSNTDEDRRTIQKEFTSGLDTINDIAIGTTYNGQNFARRQMGARRFGFTFSRRRRRKYQTHQRGYRFQGVIQCTCLVGYHKWHHKKRML
ncbi:MAG: flagellin [Selenomonadaceae bacterium]|nr:flagellin [Selenomonadaceae bacterium]